MCLFVHNNASALDLTSRFAPNIQIEVELSRVYSPIKIPGSVTDPIPAPAVDTIVREKGKISPTTISLITSGLVDRIEAHYEAQSDPETIAWLRSHPEIRSAFWLAIDHAYDHVDEAASMLGQLIAHNPDKVKEYYHLAIAMALVHDSEVSLTNSQRFVIWGINPDQYQPLPNPLELFDYFTDEKMSKKFPIPLNKLVWPLLIHLVDLDLNASERAWVISKYHNGRGNLAKTYSEVPYDYKKLEHSGVPNNRLPNYTALGARPYTMANILNYGGACADQAHYSSRVIKALGVPAIKARGEGRYGTPHAWTGYLTATKRKASFIFTGRYWYDHYYIGHVLDPQRLRFETDRNMAVDLSAALLNYEGFIQARALTRVAQSLFTTNEEMSYLLTETALEVNPLVKEGWRHLINHVKAETINLKTGGQWMSKLVKSAHEHPDLLWDILKRFLYYIPESDLKTRTKLYSNVFAVLKERPDLQIALRQWQCRELYAMDESNKATSLAVKTLNDLANEGALVLPLLELVIEDATKRPVAERKSIRKHLSKMEKTFPEKRGDTVSRAWTSMKDLLNYL